MAGTTSKNSNLHGAKRAKNDEFYTQLTDVEKELKHYKQHFAGKTVYLNCDDPTVSAFWKHFAMDFGVLGLERLIATHYTGVRGGIAYALEMTDASQYHSCSGPDCRGPNGAGCLYRYTALEGDGDFRSEESIALLEQSDIVVTNPPFSLFREYVVQLVEHDKKFVILGNPNAITYKEIFPLIMSGELWWGYKSSGGTNMFFGATSDVIDRVVGTKPEGSWWKMVNGVPLVGIKTVWFTNLDHVKRHEVLELTKKYTPEAYPKYDNYDAINVDKVYDIPVDYDGVMGVPITFLDKWNPAVFIALSH